MNKFDNKKIDLVYTWVDSNDKNWKEKKHLWLSDGGNYDTMAVDDCKFR